MVGIYKIENIINHKIYIGQSIHIERRWKEHCRNSGHSLINTAIKEYGKENFTFQILEECSNDKLNERENYYISYFNSVVPNGYNVIEINNGQSTSYTFLSKEDLLNIIQEIKKGKDFNIIAENYGISVRSIYYINNGETHKLESEIYPLRKLQDFSKKHYYCIDCGTEICDKAVRCQKCASIKSRKVDRPNREELKKLIRNNPFTKIGQMYGVTDNAIRKWCKVENLPFRAKDIKQYSDEDWSHL